MIEIVPIAYEKDVIRIKKKNDVPVCFRTRYRAGQLRRTTEASLYFALMMIMIIESGQDHRDFKMLDVGRAFYFYICYANPMSKSSEDYFLI